MTLSYLEWPTDLLRPASTLISAAPFTRSGGRSLGGIARVVRSDRGFWRIALNDIALWTPEKRRTWNAIRTQLGGAAGLIAVPAWSFDTAPYASGERDRVVELPHEDLTGFDDEAEYHQGAIAIEMATFAPLGATIVTLKLVSAATASGIRFSYQHALYETGPILSQTAADTFQVSVFPAVRQAIPAGAVLEADRPMCLCHLGEDRGMDVSLTGVGYDKVSVDFVEAVDYWNDVALSEVA